MAKKNALGRGLGALLDEQSIEKARRTSQTFEIPINNIEANPFQPRENFNEEGLKELADSIKQYGVIQPITVRVVKENKYQLISGERRLRASKLAGIENIPAYVRSANDEVMLELALVENIQREDLDAIEIAISYQRLMEECKLTQEALSERIGKKRSTISNYVRLLKLPPDIQIGIREQKISMGHARALINILDEETRLMIYKQVIKYDFSVRKVEEIVRELNNNTDKEPVKKRKKYRTPQEYEQLKKHLSKYFSTDVDFRRYVKGNGKIIIPFNTDEQLEKIIAILDKLNS
ncbi:MAG TPA: ParB/RepB/Spo0J family partition protein [Bacteroidales bacterium]|nr:ParB/RepB/Spo0J family partition protein [Bacteroidales bacterium]HRW21100.1 ParB/RepB/Spo0J family partition protein [Bacteroidales bacterium]